MAMYMGQNSPLGYGGSPLQGGQPPSAPLPTQGNPITSPVQQMPSPVASKTVPLPTAPTVGKPANVLGAEAVRANGPSQGYDPAYLQNLATAIGGLFSNSRQGGNVMRVNPLGDLSEISPSSGIGGNAPTQGLPLTWLQQALNGSAFGYAPKPPAVTPKAPVITPNRGNPGRSSEL